MRCKLEGKTFPDGRPLPHKGPVCACGLCERHCRKSCHLVPLICKCVRAGS